MCHFDIFYYLKDICWIPFCFDLLFSCLSLILSFLCRTNLESLSVENQDDDVDMGVAPLPDSPEKLIENPSAEDESIIEDNEILR